MAVSGPVKVLAWQESVVCTGEWPDIQYIAGQTFPALIDLLHISH